MARVRLCVCGSWFVGREGQAAHPRAPGQCLHFECRGAPARVRAWRCEGRPPLPHHFVCVEKSTLPYLTLSRTSGGTECTAALLQRSCGGCDWPLPPTVGSGGDAMRAVWLILLLWLRNREAMGQVSSVVREVALEPNASGSASAVVQCGARGRSSTRIIGQCGTSWGRRPP